MRESAVVSAKLLLEFLAGQPQRRATLKQLFRDLNVRGGQRQALRGLLLQLLKDGRLVARHSAYELAPSPPTAPKRKPQNLERKAPSSGDVTGRLSLHRDGYGFVIPKDGSSDIFLPPPAVGDAMHGDTVSVRVTRRRPDGRAEGRLVRIEKRAHVTVVGTLVETPRGFIVQPIDDRLREPIQIAPGQEVPLAAPATPHRVLGPEARAAKPAPGPLPANPIVDVEITAFPTATSPARGRVIEILGDRNDFGVDVEIIIRKHHLPHRFPQEALHQAAAIPAAIPAAEIARRRDFRDLPIVTIDGESARDFDDAVLVTGIPGGGFDLQVHIADVSYYVAPGSPIDLEARLRGTSVYFPDRAIPMLPAELSTDLCSLRPGLDRLVMSCLMRITPEGAVAASEIVPGVIRSAARMTYTEVNAILTGNGEERQKFAHLAAGFERMARLQAILYSRRQQRGSIDFDLPEPEIAFDEFGLMRSIVKSERNIAHRLIEEFMLAAAETVARHLEAARVPSVYRIHEQPDLKKVAEFEQVAAGFGYSLGSGPLPIKTIRERFNGRIREIDVPQPAKFRISPRNYQKLAARIAGKPEERILSFLMLRSLKQARYSSDNQGHFALATPAYTHFTSPIRRYPDLMVHRILKSQLLGERLAPELASPSTLEPICADASDSERRADDAERELMDWKKVRFMESRLGQEFPALVINVNRNGFHVELTELFIEGLVPASTLEDKNYRFQETTRTWVHPRTRHAFPLGARLTVMVERIDPVRQQIQFTPLPAE